jgi:hypothetical protein
MRRGGRDRQTALRLTSFAGHVFAPPRNAPAVVKYLLQPREADPEPENLQFDRIVPIAP